MLGVRAHDYGRKPAKELFSAIAADGWQCIQLAVSKALTGDTSSARISEQLQHSGLIVAVLGSYVDIGIVDQVLRQKEVEKFINNLTVAKELNALCIGTETTSRQNQPDQKRAIRAVKRSLSEILPIAENLGVTIAIEPVHYHTIATPELTRQILSEMKSENLKVIFDAVNLLANEDDPDEMWKRAADCFGGKICAVHCKGRKPGILLQESEIDYKRIFEIINLPKDIPILREEGSHEMAANDIEYLRSL
jgi:sugar phosphate isomerase/epimerase